MTASLSTAVIDKLQKLLLVLLLANAVFYLFLLFTYFSFFDNRATESASEDESKEDQWISSPVHLPFPIPIHIRPAPQSHTRRSPRPTASASVPPAATTNSTTAAESGEAMATMACRPSLTFEKISAKFAKEQVAKKEVVNQWVT